MYSFSGLSRNLFLEGTKYIDKITFAKGEKKKGEHVVRKEDILIRPITLYSRCRVTKRFSPAPHGNDWWFSSLFTTGQRFVFCPCSVRICQRGSVKFTLDIVTLKVERNSWAQQSWELRKLPVEPFETTLFYFLSSFLSYLIEWQYLGLSKLWSANLKIFKNMLVMPVYF